MDYTQNLISDGIDKQLGVNTVDHMQQRDIPVPQFNEPSSEPTDAEPENAQMGLEAAFSKPDPGAKTQVKDFDWGDKDRYTGNRDYSLLGVDPFAPGQKINGKDYDYNELRYNQLQTTGDVAYKALVGGGALFLDTFERQFEQWGNTARGITDLVSGKGWEQAKRDFIGTDEELMQMNKEQQEIMNKYAIYHGPDEENHIFSKEFIGDAVQQFGLGAGQGAEMLAEVFATWGIGAAFNAMRVPLTIAKGVEAAEVAERLAQGTKVASELGETGSKLAIPLEEQRVAIQSEGNILKENTQVNDVSGNNPMMTSFFQSWAGKGIKAAARTIPGSGLVEGALDIRKGMMALGDVKSAEGFANSAAAFGKGAANWGAWKGGVGTMAKEFSLFNMAATHGKLLAFTTYGQQYADLINQYEREHDGQGPDGAELDRIKNNAWMAASDNFSMNLGLIMLMGKIEWGGLYSKFNSVTRALRGVEQGVAEGGEKALFNVKGVFQKGATYGEGLGEVEEAKLGTLGQKQYEKATGLFPSWRTVNMVRKDFGLGTALWEGAKSFRKSAAVHFELGQFAEGMHLVLQNASDKAFREYYKNLYNGGTDINGHSFLDATNNIDWTAAMKKEFGMGYDPGGGWKTFIMAASNGLLMTPIHSALGGVNSRIMTKLSPDYRDAQAYRKGAIEENLKMQNTFFKSPTMALNEHLAAIKSNGKAADNMSDGISQNNEYAFQNGKDDNLAKTVSSFIKTGTYDSFLYTLKSMGNMSEKDFYDAVPNMKPTDQKEGQPLPSPQSQVDKIAKSITDYHNRYQSLMDKFSGYITPEYFEGRASRGYKEAGDRRDVAQQALLQEHKDTKFGDDHRALSEEDQAENLPKLQDYYNKGQKIDADYQNEIKGNRYAQELMKQRTLQEAVEVVAGMQHGAQRAVERMIGVKAQMLDANLVGNDISKHSSKIVKVLGNKVETQKEIEYLQQQIKLSEPVAGGKDAVSADIRKNLNAQKEQLAHLLDWQENLAYHASHDNLTEEEQKKFAEDERHHGHIVPNREGVIRNLKDAHDGYINSLEKEQSGNTAIISGPQYDQSFKLLGDHINLSKDYKHYMDAITVLSDPKGFHQLHDKIYDGIRNAMTDFYIQQRNWIKAHDEIKEETAKWNEAIAAQTKVVADREAEQKKLEITNQQEKNRIANEQRRKYRQTQLEYQGKKLTQLLQDTSAQIDKVENDWIETHQTIDTNNALIDSIQRKLNVANAQIKLNDGRTRIAKQAKLAVKECQNEIEQLRQNNESLKLKVQNLETLQASLMVTKDHFQKAINRIDKEQSTYYNENNLDTISNGLVKVRNTIDVLNKHISLVDESIVSMNSEIDDILQLIGQGEDTRINERYYTPIVATGRRLMEELEAKQSELLSLQDEMVKNAIDRNFLVQQKEHLEIILNALRDNGGVNEKVDSVIEEKKPDTAKIKAEIENYAVDPTAELSQEAQQALDSDENLQQQVTAIQKEAESVHDAAQANPGLITADVEKEKLDELKEKAAKATEASLDDSLSVPDYSHLANVPEIKYEPYGDPKLGLNYGIKFFNGTERFQTKQQAIARLEQYMKEQSKEKGRYEKFSDADGNTYQKGQYLYYRDGSQWEITAVPNDKGRVQMKNTATGISQKNDVAALKFYHDTPQESLESVPTSAAQEVEETRSAPPVFTDANGDITTNDPSKINYNDMHSIIAHQNPGESPEQAKQRLTNFILNNNISSLNDVELQVAVMSNPSLQKGQFYNLSANSNIRVSREPLAYGMNIKVAGKQQSMYLMGNGSAYEFQVSPGKWVSADKLTRDQFYNFINPPADFFYTEVTPASMDQQYQKFRSDIQKVQDFSNWMGSMKAGDTMTSTQIHDLLTFTYLPHLNYSGDIAGTDTTKPASTLGEMIAAGNSHEVETPTGEVLEPVIYNNGVDRDKFPYAAGTADVDGTTLQKVLALAPHRTKFLGMYSTFLQLPNGTVVWVELSPAKLESAEVANRLVDAWKMITEDGQFVKDVDSKEVNQLLESIFIATNPYVNGQIDFQQKYSMRLRTVRDTDAKSPTNGQWHLSVFVDNVPAQDGIDARPFQLKGFPTTAEELSTEINRALHENKKDTTEQKYPEYKAINITPESFREQVSRDDMNSIMQMKSNLSLNENNSIVQNMDVAWTFKGPQQTIVEAIPEVHEDDGPTEEEWRAMNGSGEPDEDNDSVQPPDAPDEYYLQVAREEASAFQPTKAQIADLRNNGVTKREDENGFWEQKGKLISIQQVKDILEGTAEKTETNQQDLVQETNTPTVPSVETNPREIAKQRAAQKAALDAKRSASKVDTTEEFNGRSIENIDAFTVWARQNLPSFFSVEEAATLNANMNSNFTTVGRFMSDMNTLRGIIQIGPNAPYGTGYHEAFHGVFRMLLNQKEIDQLYGIARRENPITQKKLDEFRAKGYNFTGKELEERFLEEYMANKFEQWKVNKKVQTSHVMKGFFARLADLIRELWAKLTGNQMMGLFHEINRGKYRDAKLQQNSFTSDVSISQLSADSIKVGATEYKGKVIDRYLPQQTADRLSAAISGIFIDKLNNDPVYQKTGQYNKTKLLNDILDMYRDTLDWDKREDHYTKLVKKNIKDPVAINEWWQELMDRHELFSTAEGRTAMKESVDQYLKIMGLRQKLESDQLEEDDMEYGEANTENMERKNQLSIGGYGSLPALMRQFIGATTYNITETAEGHDEFFNTTFSNGNPIVQAVNANNVYNGMLKTLSNISDANVLLDKMVQFVDNNGNPETTKFINHIFQQIGLDPVQYKTAGISAVQNQNILQQVVKAFNQYTVNTQFIAAVPGKNGMEYIPSSANVKDAAFYQMNNWQNAFSDVFMSKVTKGMTKTAIAEAIKPLETLRTYLKGSNSTLTDVQLKGDVQNNVPGIINQLSTDLQKNLGISLHPNYLYYSILKSKAEGKLSQNQKEYIDSFPTVSAIEVGPLAKIIDQLNSNDKDLFAKDSTGQVKTTAQALDFWADGNAIFDETINMMSYTNANGESVSAYVYPYFTGIAIGDMNNKQWLENLAIVQPDLYREMKDNPLLADANFQFMRSTGKMRVEFIDGMRVKESVENEGRVWNDETKEYEDTGDTEERLKEAGKEGSTYKQFSDRDFLAGLFSFYNISKQKGREVYKGDKNSFPTVLIPIRVPSEKSMFAMVPMPVIQTVSDTGGKLSLSDKALDLLYGRVKYEFDSIREMNQSRVNGLDPVGKQRVEGWNVGAMRGNKLDITAKMMGEEVRAGEIVKGELQKQIENGARNSDFQLESMEKKIKSQINKYFLNQIEQVHERMIGEGLLDAESIENNETGLMPSYLLYGLDKKYNDMLHLKENDFKRNLTQVYMNAFINTTLMNNLLHGNESKLFKNGVDAVKREGPDVGRSIEGVAPCPAMGIDIALKTFHHITFADTEVDKVLSGLQIGNKALKEDDGHGLCTDKGLLYMLYGKGSLNAKQAEIIEKIRNGTPITPAEMFDTGGLKEKGAFNSMKMVYKDGQVYLKFSVTPLFKELTSYLEKGVWKPKPGKEEAHALRERLEKYEDENDTIVIAHPQSSSKMLTRNVVPDINRIADSHFEPLQAKFFREQLENPSGKVSITDPSQPKLQMTAEQDLKTPVYFDGSWTGPDGKPYNVSHMIDIFTQSISQRLTNNFNSARNSLFNVKDVSTDLKHYIDTKEVTPLLGKFYTHALEGMEATGTDTQMLEFMKLDDSGNPIYNINFPSLLPKVTSVFFSYFSRGVLREKVPGYSLALVPPTHGIGTLVKELKSIWTEADIKKYKADKSLIGQPREWRVVTDKEQSKNRGKYKNAIRYSDKNSRKFNNLETVLQGKEPVYILDDIRDNYLKFVDDKPVGRFSESLIPAHNKQDMINGFSDDTNKGFGTRIPYVDKNSATSFEYVDQLPAYMGSVMVVPREYYERTGGDNDIDKDYVSVYDTYVKDGKRVKYGTEKTAEGKFREYVDYQKANNKDFRNKVEELNTLYNSKKAGGDITGNIDDNDDTPLTDEEIKDLFNTDVKSSVYRTALREMGLPSTVSEYTAENSKGELNNGVLNNRILSAKIALLNNEKAVEKQNTPTTTDPIIDDIAHIKELLAGGKSEHCKQVLDMMNETNVDTNSILGMTNDRGATLMGADSIGSVATTNIVYSYAHQMKLKLLPGTGITIDGHTFDSFGESRAWNPETQKYTGDRIFASLGAITNTMTDNGKERNANKLNLNKTATGMLSYMVANGVARETGELLLLQHDVVDYMREKTGRTIQSPEEEAKYIGNFIREKIQTLKDAGVTAKPNLSTTDLVNGIRDDNEESIQLAVLENLQKMEKQSETHFKVARILRLIQGVKGDMHDFDTVVDNLHDLGIVVNDGKVRAMSDEEFEKLDTVLDLRKPLLSDKHFMSTIVHAIGQLNSVMPSMFVERTDTFRDFMDGAKSSLKVPLSPVTAVKFERQLKYDGLGYLMLRAYKWALTNPEKGNPMYQLNNTLHQGLIYNGQGIDTIYERTNAIREQLDNARKGGVNNYMVNYFLVPSEASDKTGNINLLEANTWAKLSQIQQQRLLSSFVDLYQNAYMSKYNVDTHDYAVDIFNYLMVKDGGQFTNGSFIRMISPFMFKDVMDKIGDVNELLKSAGGDYSKVFGPDVTQQSLINDFLKGYTTHVGNKKYINKIGYTTSKDGKALSYKSKRSFDDIAKKYTGKNDTPWTEAEQALVDNHNEKNSSKILQLNKEKKELTVDAVGGIRPKYYAGKFNRAEREMMADNKEHLADIGFQKSGTEINFPMSVMYDNKLYTLKEVTKKQKDSKTGEEVFGPVLTDSFLQKGEYAPSGLRAVYTETTFKGSPRQFRAANAIGEVPDMTKTQKEVAIEKVQEQNQQKEVNRTEAKATLKRLGYIDKPYKLPTADGSTLTGGTRYYKVDPITKQEEMLTSANGKDIPDVFKAAERAKVLAGETTPQPAPGSPDAIQDQQKAPISTDEKKQLQTAYAKELSDVKAKYPVLPSSPAANRSLRETAEKEIHDRYKKLLSGEKEVVPSQQNLIAGMFTREELNDIYANRKTKQMSAADFKAAVEKAVSVPNITKEEVLKAIKCI